MIDQGWAALRTGDATAARDAFERALQEAESGAALEGLGLALYLQRDYPGAIAQHERAYTAYRKEGETFAAGRAARILAWITGNVLGDWAVQNGWLARAVRIFTEAGEDTPEHGWVLIIKSYTEPDATVREALFREAIAVGRRFCRSQHRDRSVVLSRRSVSHDRPGRRRAGDCWMNRWPQLCAGELTEMATVDSLFCGLFWACELVNDVPRADQWMRAASGVMANRERGRCVLPRALRRHTHRGRTVAGGRSAAHRRRPPL